MTIDLKINPRNFTKRKLEFLPPHFVTTNVYLSDYQETKINQWIYENCYGRYCMVKTVSWIKDSWKCLTTIGFEEPSDMTLLGLFGVLNKDTPPF